MSTRGSRAQGVESGDRRRGLRAAGAVALLALVTATGSAAARSVPEASQRSHRPGAGAGGSVLKLVAVASGLESPLHLATTPSEPRRLYVVEKAGRIRVIAKGRLLGRPFLDLTGIVESSRDEQGLLSVAFHPDYAENRRFYVYYTGLGSNIRLVEYRSRKGKPARALRVLLSVEQPFSHHIGGQLAFGPGGLLYVGIGDGAPSRDPQNRAQDLGSPFGKLLKLDVGARAAEWVIAGYGLRNPWRFSFDRLTGDLYIGDVGQNEREEVDFTPRTSPGLENYGWDVFEGTHVFEDKQPNPTGTLVSPIVEYDHGEGCSVTGGFVYRGKRIPAAVGRYFYGDYCSGTIWSLRVAGGETTDVTRHGITVGSLSSFGEGVRGELFLVSLAGSIYRLASAS
jgi:glucose/arabinose dehydrogenase